MANFIKEIFDFFLVFVIFKMQINVNKCINATTPMESCNLSICSVMLAEVPNLHPFSNKNGIKIECEKKGGGGLTSKGHSCVGC